MNSPRFLWLKRLATAALASAALSACAVSPDGPAGSGAARGSLGSSDMSDYYYHKQAGWTYTYQNVEHIYNSNGSVTTLTGAPDYVQTMGFDGFAPTGDSLFRIQITYRVLTTYAGRGEMTVNYICNGNSSNGAFVDGNASLPGMTTMNKRPRPVSTDTILAGMAGLIRTRADDFTNSGSYVWQTDTLWFTSGGDSVVIWERFPNSTALSPSRVMFSRDFVNNVNSNGNGSNVSWMYDLIWGTTYVNVSDANTSLTTPAGSYSYVAKLEVVTPSLSDNMPIREYKWFACFTGAVMQYDVWQVTTDGKNFTKEDFTRSLISLTHN